MCTSDLLDGAKQNIRVKEEWRPVIGWEGYYEVSSLGRLRSLPREITNSHGGISHISGKIHSLKPSPDGYVRALLSRDGKRVSVQMHNLVAKAFIANDNDYNCVLHRNGLLNDNSVENLEWCKFGEARRRVDNGEMTIGVMPYSQVIEQKDNPDEEWRDINGYGGEYQISNFGRVFSNKSMKFLDHGLSPCGYPQVVLCHGGHKKLYRVHRLVAEAFIPNPDNIPYINHKNEIKTDARACNLEWCTAEYNNNYNDGQKRRALNRDNHAISIRKNKPVLQFNVDGSFVRRWESIKAASIALGISETAIGSACRRDQRGSRAQGISVGYRWDFEGVDYNAQTS